MIALGTGIVSPTLKISLLMFHQSYNKSEFLKSSLNGNQGEITFLKKKVVQYVL